MVETSGHISRYEILGEIGRGGMGLVYRSRHLELDRIDALKALHAIAVSDPNVARRFLHEARVAGGMRHPNIVTVYDYFESGGTPYIAMEYLERGSLRPYIAALTLAQFGGVLADVLAGLRHAERRDVVHRDLKPENLLVTDEGSVKIADFGIAKATSRISAAAFRTATGMTVGTPGYMAPEQAMARNLGPWTDLYSVGCMAYEMCVGHTPFADTAEPLALLLRHVNEPILPARLANPEVRPDVSAWIDALLVKDPARRTASAQIAWDALEEILIAAIGPRWRRSAALSDAIPASPVPRAFGPDAGRSRASILLGPDIADQLSAAQAPAAQALGSALQTPPPASAPPYHGTPPSEQSVPGPYTPPPEQAVPGPYTPPPEQAVPGPYTPPPEQATTRDGLADPQDPEPDTPPSERWTSAGFVTFEHVPPAIPPSDAGVAESTTDELPPPDIESDDVRQITPRPAAAIEAALPTPRVDPPPTADPDAAGAASNLPVTVPPQSRSLHPSAAPRGRSQIVARRRVLFGVCALSTLAAISIVSVIGLGSTGGDTSGGNSGAPLQSASPNRLTIGPESVQIPAHWVPLSKSAQVTGLDAQDSATAAPGEDRATSITIGMAPPAAVGPSLLPTSLVGKLAGAAPPAPTTVALGPAHVQAYRYDPLKLLGDPRALTLFAVPTSAGVAVVVCASPPAAKKMRGACQQAASSLTLRGVRAFPVGPSKPYADTLNREFERLDRAVSQGVRAMRQARTARVESRSAGDIAPAFERVARELGGLHISPADAQANRRLIGTLRAAAGAYRDLATAARNAAGGKYQQAIRRVLRAHGAINAEIARIVDGGYRDLLGTRLPAPTLPSLKPVAAPTPSATPTRTPRPTVTPPPPPATPTPTPFTPTPTSTPITPTPSPITPTPTPIPPSGGG